MHILGMSLRGLMRQRSAGPQPPTQAAAVAPATPATSPASGMGGILARVAAQAHGGVPSAPPIGPSSAMGGMLSHLGQQPGASGLPMGTNVPLSGASPSAGAVGFAKLGPQGSSAMGGMLARLGLSGAGPWSNGSASGISGNAGAPTLSAPSNTPDSAPSDGSGLVSRMRQSLSGADDTSSEY